jgi:hypothetical protein
MRELFLPLAVICATFFLSARLGTRLQHHLTLPLIHACISVLAASFVLLFDRGSGSFFFVFFFFVVFPFPFLPGPSLLCHPSRMVRFLLALDVGYYLSELWTQHSNDRQRVQPAVWVHHLTLVLCFTLLLFVPAPCKGDFYLACLMIMNASNIPMHLGRIYRSGVCHTVSKLTFVPVFLLSRFGIFLYLFQAFGASKSLSWWQALAHLRLECRLMTGLVLLFNLYLFSIVCGKMMRTG